MSKFKLKDNRDFEFWLRLTTESEFFNGIDQRIAYVLPCVDDSGVAYEYNGTKWILYEHFWNDSGVVFSEQISYNINGENLLSDDFSHVEIKMLQDTYYDIKFRFKSA